MSHLSYLKYISKLQNKSKPLNIGTDCSGIDAPIEALKLMGINFNYKFASDIDADCKKSIETNGKPNMFYDDITSRNHSKLQKLDIYIAGFPCQSFSTLGKQRGFDDPSNRGIIFFHCCSTIHYTQPEVFILENVKGLTTHDNGNTFDIILQSLESLGNYNIYYDIYNTMNYGIPQHRERIYIIGIKTNYKSAYEVPQHIKLTTRIEDILEKKVTDPYYKELTPHKIDILNDLLDNGVIDSFDNNWLVNLNLSSYKRTGAKLDICPCLLAGSGGNCTFFITSLGRKLTPLEYLRLQGFPDTFIKTSSRSKLYKQAGNSMSVNVLCFIFKSIFKVINY